MRAPQQLSLPLAGPEYDPYNEQTARRSIEQAYAALRNDVQSLRDQKTGSASLALRRQQFLLMGAGNG